jgi:Transglycosylase SLT domain
MTRYLLSILTTVTLLAGVRADGAADPVTLLHQAAHRYDVPNSLLLAIAYVESKGVLTALNVDGTSVFPRTWEEGQQLVDRHARDNLDVGLMQVNIPTWSGRLRLSPRTLYQPQVNLPVAAYVLRRCIDDSGGDLWKGVGCYHSPRLGSQRKYVDRVWSAYTTLRQRGVFGPTPQSTSDVAREPVAAVVPIGSLPLAPPTPRSAPQPVTDPPLGQWRPAPSGVPACPGQHPQQRTTTGRGGLTLVFFRAGQAWPALDETPHALVMGLCVDCRLGELVPLSTTLGYPVQVAAPALLTQLQVTCLPTVMRLTASTDATEVRP